jgi:hypothetical protein
VAILVFDTAASASAVLDAFDVTDTADCLNRFESQPVEVETADPLEAGGMTAEEVLGDVVDALQASGA